MNRYLATGSGAQNLNEPGIEDETESYMQFESIPDFVKGPLRAPQLDVLVLERATPKEDHPVNIDVDISSNSQASAIQETVTTNGGAPQLGRRNFYLLILYEMFPIFAI